MKTKLMILSLFSVALAMITVSCSKEVKSTPSFIFKKAPDTSVALKLAGKTYTHTELNKGIENDIYEAEMKVHEIKMNKLNAFILEKLMETHPGKKGLSNDEFLQKFIIKGAQPTDKDVAEFITERKIPKEHLNDQMKQRIKAFLVLELKKKYIEKWIAEQTRKSSVEVYITKPTRPVFDVKVGDAPFMGGADAKVTIVEFSDFQCPFCQKGEKIIKDLKKKYGNKIKIAFKQFPLPFHSHAKGAAEAALCAKSLGGNEKFWLLHDAMFGNQSKLDKSSLLDAAVKLGLKKAEFEKCQNSGKFTAKVEAEMEEGKKIGVKSTPTFFVNGKIINGAHPLETFSTIIDEELTK
ncbi:MAG: DsbA family protein [Bacteriovoracaceae bacterium]|jgi:protein-disulfide isomerase|nr:DsbA family protein [Bacteriovoracaceae bacterium]